MSYEWSLDVFYKGINDPALAADMAKLEEKTAAYKEMIAALGTEEPAVTLRKVVDAKEEMGILMRRLGGYFSLRRSANSADSEGASYQTKIGALMASTAKENVMFEKYAGALENLEDILDTDEVLSQYKFYFSQIQKAVAHKMSDEASPA